MVGLKSLDPSIMITNMKLIGLVLVKLRDLVDSSAALMKRQSSLTIFPP